MALTVNLCRDQNVVILNSQKGCLGQEVRHPLPSELNQKTLFEVEISYTTCNIFQIYINRKLLANFPARGTITDISSVQVKSDAYFYDVQLLRTVDKPFVDTLPLTIGFWVSVTGVVEKSPGSFEINFQAGDSPSYGCDIVFNFNPLIYIGCTVRNSLLCGSWGAHELGGGGLFFEKEEKFEIIFLVSCAVYKVFVNGKFYIDYAHRVEPSRVSHVMLNGDAVSFKRDCC